MSKSKLEQAIISVNKRYSLGLNDDDQVLRMVNADAKCKGYTFRPTEGDMYEICTDEERFAELVKKYGYWSEPVKRFNVTLVSKGGFEYKTKINLPYTGADNIKK